jgi:hypothetical protein
MAHYWLSIYISQLSISLKMTLIHQLKWFLIVFLTFLVLHRISWKGRLFLFKMSQVQPPLSQNVSLELYCASVICLSFIFR